jgi:hypothetical protein
VQLKSLEILSDIIQDTKNKRKNKEEIKLKFSGLNFQKNLTYPADLFETFGDFREKLSKFLKLETELHFSLDQRNYLEPNHYLLSLSDLGI